ncbi:hypothetical protein JCM8097_007137 [Rhodosporidiobolus ruineniae]
MLALLSLAALFPTFALAAPAPSEWTYKTALKEFEVPTNWSAGAHKGYSVSSTCTFDERRAIGDGLDEALELAAQARDHLRRYGNDTIFNAWFGSETDPNLLLGLYDRLVDGDKTGITFRCDDVDDECNGKYGIIPGYFRATAKDETVVCPTYYLAKPRLEETCVNRWTLANNGSELTQGAWFMHRLLHLPTGSGGRLSDVVDTVGAALELAQGVNHTQAAYSIHTVQYYALDVYAYDILAPGVGCRGDPNAADAQKEE